MAHSYIEYGNASPKKCLLFLWLFCVIGFWSLFPYIQFLKILPSSEPILKILLIGTIQTTLFFGLICYLSYKVLPKTNLQPLVVKDIFKQIVLPGVIFGVLVGLIIFFLDKTVFQDSLLLGFHPPFWVGVLASIYGAVNEEVLLRLFLFTLVYSFLGKFFEVTANNRLWFLWIVNTIVAIVFGLGHLPAALKLITPSSFEIFRILLLNGIPGIVFGWLYWSRGLWTAMAAHFVADLMIHVFLIR